MSGLAEKLRLWNEEWKGLPRKLLTILIGLACLFFALWAFPYVAPFALAALFAWMIEPAVRLVTKPFGKKKLARNIASALFVTLLVATAIVVLFILAGRVLDELKGLALALPDWVRLVSADILNWVDGLDLKWVEIDASVQEAVFRLLSDLTSMLTSLASRTASTVARVAWRAASLLPQSLLFIVLTLVGTFYMSSDKERIFGFLTGLLPEKYRQRSSLLRANVLRALLAQLRVALIMLLVIFAELSIGFLLMGLSYPILFALILAAVDALPVLGTGLVLLPMCAFGIAVGNPTFAFGGGLLYLGTILLRQLLEPRIIGHQLGLYPLATMMAMYAGLKAVGFLGMLFGPLVLLLCKVALTSESDLGREPGKRKPMPPWGAWWERRRGRHKDGGS
ncbi:MAG: sporulation integral membrane protein YtvI [Firmicutes bacterium]|nr:sporulation integral membrane protein YtvI [Bacillota bacterium]